MSQAAKNDPENTKVLYQCTCGRQLELLEDYGGSCPSCQQKISPKLLHHDLAMTMTLGTLPNGPEGGGTIYFDAEPPLDPESEQDVEEQVDVKEGAKHIAKESLEQIAGKKFGHFQIIDPLGRGGMGQVFRALDTSLKRYVAVKVLRSGIETGTSSASSDLEIDLLLQEAVTQARVTHPNIVTIYYVGKQNDDPFLAMELINGHTILEKLDDGPMAYPEIHSIATQITSALQFSHELDIIHGDIKPSNILVQRNGIAKLSDFGMARRASDTERRSVGGTPNYLAPETMKGETPTIQSDMYALGATLYQMTFGGLPVNMSGRTVEEWLKCHQQEPVEFPMPWPENLAEGWQDMLKKLLAKDPADRFDSWAEVESELQKIEPAPAISAKRVPRLVAAIIDLMLVALLISPFQLLSATPYIESMLSQSALTAFLMLTLNFGAIAAYTLLVVLWKQSPGRKLMHVRVVNKYGLKVSRQTMATRSLMRMVIIWFATVATISAAAGTDGWVSIAAQTVAIVGVVLTAIDIAVMMMREKGRSLHDLISQTWVVVDTD
jgi:serine/threonine protein kinase/DNA-directed RNA polymerase subunit RPC12/RpoP